MNGILRGMRQFILEPIKKRSRALFFLQITQLIHDRTGGRWDEPLRRLISHLRPPASLPESHFLSNAEITSAVDMVRERGWSILPRRISKEDITELNSFAFSTQAYTDLCTDKVAPDLILSRQHPRYQWLIGDLLKVPAIAELLKDSALYRIAQDYLQCQPILTSITIWLDGVYNGAFDAHVYHYDNDGPGFLKFFIYLSDVDHETGAHTFIQGSHGRKKPARFRRATRYDSNELLDHYGLQNEIVFSAPAGTIIAEDTAGFHRGMDPKKNYRLLLQLEYSVLDIPHIEEFTVGIPKIKINGIDPEIAAIARKFVTNKSAI